MSDQPTLLVTRTLPGPVEARISHDYNAQLNSDDAQYDADALIASSHGIDAILTCSTEKFSASVIERLSDSVRAIATYSVGHEHIDLEAARARNIIVTNTPDVLTDATADIALLCLLGAARRARESSQVLRNGDWGRWESTTLLGVHLGGKKLGVLGMGRIGRAVAKRARAFGMKIHYNNRSRLTPELEEGAIFHADPEAMLGHCEFLSINCPSTSETRHFLDAKRVAMLPDGAVVVNSARGDIVVDADLIAAVESGKVSGVGLDVYDREPKFNPGYATLKNAFLVPHIGSATVDTRNEMGFRALDNLDAIFAGNTPTDQIT
ncbi:MAG: 2-hydroxyacid dehydrogenase [Alphaproteobacteria bacterium]|jgi:lactate dehydrogenase-like 2-hydroxyacid dehydrogenase